MTRPCRRLNITANRAPAAPVIRMPARRCHAETSIKMARLGARDSPAVSPPPIPPEGRGGSGWINSKKRGISAGRKGLSLHGRDDGSARRLNPFELIPDRGELTAGDDVGVSSKSPPPPYSLYISLST